MCWSFEGSLITYIVSLFVALFLLKRNHPNDIIFAVLLLTYSLMQLWEAIMWKNQPSTEACPPLNITATKAAYYTLWLHALAVAVGIFIQYRVKLPLVIGGLVLALGLFLSPKIWSCSVPSKRNKHLVWGFDPRFYVFVFAICLLLCLLYVRPMKTALIINALFLSSFLFAFFTGKEAVGSYWCWICAFFSFVFIACN